MKYFKFRQNNRMILLIVFVGMCIQSFALPGLHISGKRVVNSQNETVILTGVNLGGWLVTENWMCGITDTLNDDRFVLNTLEDRFGEERADSLIQIWQDHWITSRDLDSIKQMGFNFVRVPFGWRNLQNKRQEWNLNSMGQIDFSRFDWIVQECEKRGMYVLFDNHIWFNQKEAYNTISDVDSVKIHTAQIWKTVAAHFAGNTTVLGYDLLNEPTASWNDHVMQMLYDSVRSVDASHIISMEWTKPNPDRWDNVLYQDHYYDLKSLSFSENQNYFTQNYEPQIQLHDSLNVPFYIGETHGFDSDSTLSWALQEYCNRGLTWSPWTYKTVNMWGWGVVSMDLDSTKVNANTDSYEKIKSQWSNLSKLSAMNVVESNRKIWSEASANCNTTEFTTKTILPQHSPLSKMIQKKMQFYDLLGRKKSSMNGLFILQPSLSP